MQWRRLMTKIQINKMLTVIGLLSLSACSSNVSGEWDCPRQQGQGCITINNADQMALRKIEQPIEKPSLRVQQEEQIWFAPAYIDSREGR